MRDRHRCPTCGRTMTLVPGWQGKKVRCPDCSTLSVVGAPSQQITAAPAGKIRFNCRECDRLLQVPVARSGSSVTCPQCGFRTEVPATDTPPADDEEADGGTYQLTDADDPLDDPAAERCPFCEAALSPDAVRCPECKRRLRKRGDPRDEDVLGTTWTVWLSLFSWQRFRVEMGKSGQPILVRTNSNWFSSSPPKVVDLTKFACLGLENEVPRERGINWFALMMFLFTCGIIWLILIDTGSRRGSWVLRLNREGETDGMILYRNRNLSRVHAIRDVVTAHCGLRVGRAY